jgi:hypothetical protein
MFGGALEGSVGMTKALKSFPLAAVLLLAAASGMAQDEAETERDGAEAVSGATWASSEARSAVPVATDAPAASSTGPGMEMALKMMLTTQLISTVLLALLFGAVMFWIGYTIGKAGPRNSR